MDSHANFLPTLESCLRGTWQRDILRKNWSTEVSPSRIILFKAQALGHPDLSSRVGAGCFVPSLSSGHHGGNSCIWLCQYLLEGAGKGGPLGVLRDKRCCIIGKQILMRTSVFLPRGLGISSKQTQGCVAVFVLVWRHSVLYEYSDSPPECTLLQGSHVMTDRQWAAT